MHDSTNMTKTNDVLARDFHVDDSFIKSGKSFVIAYCAGALVGLYTLVARIEEMESAGEISPKLARKILDDARELSEQMHAMGMLWECLK